MEHKCPNCKSVNTTELGGDYYNNISCDNCGCLSVVTWQNYKQRAEAAEARAAELLKRLEDAQVYIGKLEQERDHWIDAYQAQEDGYNAAVAGASKYAAERDRANQGFAALKNEYDKAMSRLAAHGEKVTA